MPPLDDKTRNQRQVFDFFVERFRSQQTFTKADLRGVTSWNQKSFDTYWSKQFKQFVIAANQREFRVSEAFRSFATWERFRAHVTQVRRVAADYSRDIFANVLIYEFYMPLTNETPLRTTLDALFYKDTILARLRARDRGELEARFPRQEDEDDEQYLDRACTWIAGFVVGYSISHVSGRFRAEEIATIADGARIEADGGRYLIDETTAVVRFIFPCADEEVAERVAWFFDALFVQSIVQAVNGEDQIWMVETGLRNRLHIWRVEE